MDVIERSADLYQPSVFRAEEPNLRIGDLFKESYMQAYVDMPTMKAARWSLYDQASMHGEILQPEELDDRYGIEGILKFDEPLTVGQARLRNEWAQEEYDRNMKLDRVRNPAARLGASLVSGFAAGFSDPIMLPLNLAPWHKAIPAMRALQAGGASFTSQMLKRGVVDGLAAGLATESMTALLSRHSDKQYTAKDAMFNLVVGTGLGLAGELFTGAKLDITTRRTRARVEGMLREHNARFNQLDGVTQERMVNATMMDALSDQPMHRARVEAMLDEGELYTRAARIIEAQHADQISRMGFDVDAEPTTTAGYRWNGAAVADPNPSRPVYTTGNVDGVIKQNDVAIFTSELRDIADSAAMDGETIIASGMNMRNPADELHVRRLAKRLGKKYDPDNPLEMLSDRDIIRAAKEEGFDGFVAKDTRTGSDLYAIFGVEQMGIAGRMDEAMGHVGTVGGMRNAARNNVEVARNAIIDMAMEDDAARHKRRIDMRKEIQDQPVRERTAIELEDDPSDAFLRQADEEQAQLENLTIEETRPIAEADDALARIDEFDNATDVGIACVIGAL